MGKFRVDILAIEVATEIARQTLASARDERSRLSAQVDQCEDQLRALGSHKHRGRAYRNLQDDYEELQDQLRDAHARVYVAREAYDLSRDVLDELIEEKKRSKLRDYDEETPSRRSTQHRAPQPRETHRTANGSSSSSESAHSHHFHRAQYSSDSGYDSPRHPRASPAPRQSGSHCDPRGSHRPPPRPFDYYDDDDEEDFTTEDRGYEGPSGCYFTQEDVRRSQQYGQQSGHAGPTPYAHYYTQERVPLSEQHRQQSAYPRFTPPYTTEERRPRWAESQYSEPQPDFRGHHSGFTPHYTTEEREPGSSYRQQSEPQPDSRPREAPQDHSHSRRSAPRTHQNSREDGHYRGTPPHEHRSDERGDAGDPPHQRIPRSTGPPVQGKVDGWWKYANECFKDYSQIDRFPCPPGFSCGKPECNVTSGPLDTCECNIRACFEMVKGLNPKRERFRWHPDKFAKCKAHLKEDFEKKASVTFAVLSKMLEKKEGEKQDQTVSAKFHSIFTQHLSSLPPSNGIHTLSLFLDSDIDSEQSLLVFFDKAIDSRGGVGELNLNLAPILMLTVSSVYIHSFNIPSIMDPTAELRWRLSQAEQAALPFHNAYNAAQQELQGRLAILNNLLDGGFAVMSLGFGEALAEYELRRANDAYNEAHDAASEAKGRLDRSEAIVTRLRTELKQAEAHICAEEERKKKAERQKREPKPNTKTKAETKPHTTQPQPQPQIRRPTPPEQWKQHADAVLSNYAAMTVFPYPPNRRCTKPTCTSTKGTRALQACKCDIRAAFQSIPDLDPKKERLKWHPDRFSACPEENREKFKKMAQEVFCVIDEMYQGR